MGAKRSQRTVCLIPVEELTPAFPHSQPDLSGHPAFVTWKVPLPWNCSLAELVGMYSAKAASLVNF